LWYTNLARSRGGGAFRREKRRPGKQISLGAGLWDRPGLQQGDSSVVVKSPAVLLPVAAAIVAAFCGAAKASPQNPPYGFVAVQGSKLVIGGQPIRVKGTNYYPRDGMWASMWTNWNWNAILADTDRMRSLGLNAVRILVPYSHGGWNGPNPPETRLQQLESLVNHLGANGIRSCVTLFDWETSYPAAGTQRENEHKSYVNAIVGRLKNNPYVFMWDVKNEPDHPSSINGFDDWDNAPAQRDKIVSWLSRMAAHIRTIDPHHPVSVGMRWYNNNKDVIGFVDIVCFHSYWSHITNNTEIPVIKSFMGANPKPILAQEFGWPTNPTPCNRDGRLIWDYNETQQLAMYQQWLQAFENHDIAGCLQWMTYDAKNYTTNPNESFENYFGLWRYDYSLKPAGAHYRDNFLTRFFPGAPPSPLQNFSVQSMDTAVRLSWQNPTGTFARAVIRVRTDGYPQSITDGEPVCDRPAPPGSWDSFVHTGLMNGRVYYYSAFAVDSSGQSSAPVNGLGRPSQPQGGDRCGTVKLLPENASVTLLRKVVTAVFPADGVTYVSEPDRSAGVRVEAVASGVSVGDTVNVSGKVRTRVLSGVNAERSVTEASIARVDLPPVMLQGLRMRGIQVGGGPVAPYLAGARDGSGLNSVGQLVTVVGRVSAVAGTVIFVDDGSGVVDAAGRTGVMVRCPGSSLPVAVGDLCVVTGVVEGSVPTGWTTIRRLVRTRDWSDIVRLN